MTTGIPGLDLVLNGGLQHGAVVVMAGATGAGKTILAQQMCFANGTPEHKCVYYTTVSEPHSKLVRHLEQFDFFDPAAVGAAEASGQAGTRSRSAPLASRSSRA